jgi:aryl-alcohol dehydrogenase-like predicted oxidoreductase
LASEGASDVPSADVISSKSPKQNLFLGRPISAVGYGAFRLTESSRQSLDYALQNGINIIDTGSHFEKGQSEATIGSVLKRRIGSGVLTRSNLTIISKSGYLDPSFAESLPKSLKKSILSNGLMHSIDPLFLEKDLSSSLNRLGTDYVDVFMINNPERLLQCKDKKWTMEAVLDSICKAMQHFKKELDRGMIF